MSQPQDTAGLQAQLDAALDRIRRLEEQLSAAEAIASDEPQCNREAVERLTAIVEGFIEIMRPGEPRTLGTVPPDPAGGGQVIVDTDTFSAAARFVTGV